MGGRGSLSGVGAVRREQEEDERDLSFLHYPYITSHHSCISSSILTLLKWMLEVLLGYLSAPRPRNVLSASSEYDKRDGLPPGRTWVLVIMYWLFGTPRSLPYMSLSISPPIRAHPVETSDHSRISPTRSDDDNRSRRSPSSQTSRSVDHCPNSSGFLPSGSYTTIQPRQRS